ncbi:MAG: hypothetical protein ABL921_28275 [Pirellula sp.]
MTVRQLLARTPQLSEEYVLTLGAAVYYFSLAEWMAVYCCEAMHAGYVRDVANKDLKITARNIAEKLISLTKKLPTSAEQQHLLIASETFLALVTDERNNLLHSYPAAVENNAVLHNPKIHRTFSIAELEEYARQSFDCNHALNTSYYKFLRPSNSHVGP